MEAKVTLTAQNALQLKNLLLNAPPVRIKPQTETPMPSPAEPVRKTQDAEPDSKPGSDQKAMLEQIAKLLTSLDREVKFEVLEDAGVVQFQVINASDGEVVRKVPADEVIRFLEQMKKNMQKRVDDRVNLLA